MEGSERLRRIWYVFQKAFGSSQTFQNRKEAKEDSQFKGKITETVQTLERRLSRHYRRGRGRPSCFFPGATGSEAAGVQPIMMTLLEAIAQCAQLDHYEKQESRANEGAKPPSSPPKAVSQPKGCIRPLTLLFGNVDDTLLFCLMDLCSYPSKSSQVSA